MDNKLSQAIQKDFASLLVAEPEFSIDTILGMLQIQYQLGRSEIVANITKDCRNANSKIASEDNT